GTEPPPPPPPPEDPPPPGTPHPPEPPPATMPRQPGFVAPPPEPPSSFQPEPSSTFPPGPSPSIPPPPAAADSGPNRASRTIVLVLAALFLATAFLAWQRLCVRLPAGLLLSGQLCVHANIWHGKAAGLGWIAGIAAILLVLWEGAALAGA